MHAQHSPTQPFAPKAPTFELKIVPIGNSQGVRLSRPMLRQFGNTGNITAELRPEGILLRSAPTGKLSLDDTFTQMALEQENWTDFDATSADGLAALPW